MNPVATMAFGARIKVASQLDARQLVQSLLVNENRWESLLGPFWPYLLAILFHMAACSLVCFMSIYRRYGLFLRVCSSIFKFESSRDNFAAQVRSCGFLVNNAIVCTPSAKTLTGMTICSRIAFFLRQ